MWLIYDGRWTRHVDTDGADPLSAPGKHALSAPGKHAIRTGPNHLGLGAEWTAERERKQQGDTSDPARDDAPGRWRLRSNWSSVRIPRSEIARHLLRGDFYVFFSADVKDACSVPYVVEIGGRAIAAFNAPNRIEAEAFIDEGSVEGAPGLLTSPPNLGGKT
jgi:hypothetical protein